MSEGIKTKSPYSLGPNMPAGPGYGLVAIGGGDNANELAQPVRWIFVGTGGSVAVQDMFGNDISFKNVANGQLLGPFLVKKVYGSSATTASDMVGFL